MTTTGISRVASMLLVGLLLAPVSSAREHDCTFCHGLHGTDIVPAAAQVEVICLNCHGAGGISSLKADIHKNKPGKGTSPPEFSFSFTCTDCHNPHEGESFVNWRGGANTKMLGRADLPAANGVTVFEVPGLGLRNVVFPTVQTSPPSGGGFVDRDGLLDSPPFAEFDGVCETCHTDPALGHHPNELCVDNCGDKNHNKSKSCPQCHLHDNFFWR